MRWRLLPEKYGPEIKHIKGHINIGTEALSRLLKQGDIVDDLGVVLSFVSVEANIFQENLQAIHKHQISQPSLRQVQHVKSLRNRGRSTVNYHPNMYL